ncbi:MAG TPA: hypothetical protein V6D20_16105 [Candidatus Obscuribacterales bacterium]
MLSPVWAKFLPLSLGKGIWVYSKRDRPRESDRVLIDSVVPRSGRGYNATRTTWLILPPSAP